jgi:hypothetical protein
MQVLKPRLPLKLFKAPGSFNYKRLMDAMGDNFGNCVMQKILYYLVVCIA